MRPFWKRRIPFPVQSLAMVCVSMDKKGLGSSHQPSFPWSAFPALSQVGTILHLFQKSIETCPWKENRTRFKGWILIGPRLLLIFVFGVLLVTIHGLQCRKVDGGGNGRPYKGNYFFICKGGWKYCSNHPAFLSGKKVERGECGNQRIAVQNSFL